VDTLDLYSARQRASFIREAATQTQQKEEVIKKDLGKVFLKLLGKNLAKRIVGIFIYHGLAHVGKRNCTAGCVEMVAVAGAGGWR
jgi:hypothetical protein